MALKSQGVKISAESTINNWNESFPECPLKLEDLKNPYSLMGAILFIFRKLGIDIAFICAPPEDNDNESLPYYWDLIPIINTVRVVNDLLLKVTQVENGTTIMLILQPTLFDSHRVIMILFNLYLFTETWSANNAELEKGIFDKADEVTALERRKLELHDQLNKQAKEKGERMQRLEELRPEVTQLEEQLKQEREAHNEEKQQQLEPLLKKNHQLKLLLEQKKAQRDALLAEVERKKALRVYDAEEIRAKHEKAVQNVKEEEDKLNSLHAKLLNKETSLKNLQTIKPSLDAANAHLQEIMKLTDSLREFETDDLETNGRESAQDSFDTELNNLQATFNELQTARAEALARRQESQAKRESETEQLQSALREAEEKAKKHRDRSKKTAQLFEEYKQLIVNREREMEAGREELADIKRKYIQDIKLAEEMLINKMVELEKTVVEKLKKRHL